ncbi:MAG TPA: PTS sugar transporter subunit IIA [Candidatus Syntrophosphaera sp.]|nr:PTS sugar transporter subunit IIA [Candidatus Syntrophosphaera sp.]HQM79552.1 PTS sugar transporter subunit IIA [Candidatus Syntrophosphaera sp.]
MNRLIEPELVKIVNSFESKNECLDYMVGLLAESGCLNKPDRFLAAVKGREEIMSTGIGKGVALPHARDLTVNALKMAVCVIRQPLDFMSVDNLPVQLVFMIAVPQDLNKEYMKILRILAEYLRDNDRRQNLINARDEEELYNEVQHIEETMFNALTI